MHPSCVLKPTQVGNTYTRKSAPGLSTENTAKDRSQAFLGPSVRLGQGQQVLLRTVNAGQCFVMAGIFQREDYSSTYSFVRGRAQQMGMWPDPSSRFPTKDDDTIKVFIIWEATGEMGEEGTHITRLISLHREVGKPPSKNAAFVECLLSSQDQQPFTHLRT